MATGIVLGLNAYHADSAACLLTDGELVAAAEEERFRRLKHWAGFRGTLFVGMYHESRCSRCVVGLSDASHVAINQDSKANLWNKVGYTCSRRRGMRAGRSNIPSPASAGRLWLGKKLSSAFAILNSPTDARRAPIAAARHKAVPFR